ncbi:MAG: agmatine deiminase family protein [Acidobacteria bacterium]|jgi:agmatine/peptidylarginine deiminase|nr:agmatine deiminase family protein [Acidobacteriota bacterium]
MIPVRTLARALQAALFASITAASAALAAAPAAAPPAAARPTPYERIMADPDRPTDPYYLSTPAWDEATQGPLPRWRVGPDGRNATPAPRPGRPLVPRRYDAPASRSAPRSCRIEAPPEYSPTAGVLFRWQSSSFDDVVTDLVAALTGDPDHDELAYVVVANSSQQNAARNAFTAAGADLAKVRFIIMPSDSVWIRDYGPHFIWQDGADAIVDSHYYPGRPLDNFIPTLLADDYFVNPSWDMPLYYSGGNFQPSADRQGFVTELVFEDNPGFTEETVAALYQEYQGIDTLHVMPQLPPSVDGTGHIDMWMYLVDEDTVIISEFLPGSNPEAIAITNNAVPYMQALGYEVLRTPAFNASHPFGPTHFTYTNAYRVNDRIFVTTYGAGNPAYVTYDNQALAAWQQAAGPGVEIVPIDAYTIIWASGAFHCIVMQVPRFRGTAPRACLTGPAGGELLVPGTTQEITWTAADDAAVTAVDLYYSLDGGASWPPEQVIATGLADDGSHAWSVPQSESARVRVKAIARDAAGGAAESVSPADLEIESAFRKSYSFATGAGTDRFAWGDKTASWAQVGGVRRPVNSQLSPANYTKISASDATGGAGDTNRYVSTMTSPGDLQAESTHVFEFTLAESPSKIREIAVRWEGFVGSCAQGELYAWDYVSSQWCDGRGGCGENAFLDNFAGNRDGNLAARIRGDVGRFVGPGGQFTLLHYAERPYSRSFHDFVSVTVTWDECPGQDADFDGWGDACDNCALVSNNQANADGDARGDACDCAVSDATVFAAPQEIRNVGYLARGATLAWDSDAPNSGSSTIYQVLQGVAGQYPVGSGAGESCAANSVAGTTLGGIPTPVAGSGYYHLVRGRNGCGTGTYGAASSGAERTSAACP